MVITPAQLGFMPIDAATPPERQTAWEMSLRGRMVRFKSLKTLEEFAPVERIEREALGFDDVDLLSASALLTVPETGGAVLTAFLDDGDGERMIAAGIGWGGFVDGRARLISDFLGVDRAARSLGIGAAMKRLQAATASIAGFEEIVWTVDPLRAANARLNFGKLRAYAEHYERNRYGEMMGQSHYGGLPSDRLHVTWPLTSERVIAALRQEPPRTRDRGATRLVNVPDDIDAIIAGSKAAAFDWRLRVRGELEPLLAEGWIITDLVAAHHDEGASALLLERPGRDAQNRPLLD